MFQTLPRGRSELKSSCNIAPTLSYDQLNVNLNSLDDERGDHVERHPHQVEEGQGHERDLGVEDVVDVDEHERGERRERDEERRRREEERLNGAEVGGLLERRHFVVTNGANLVDERRLTGVQLEHLDPVQDLVHEPMIGQGRG